MHLQSFQLMESQEHLVGNLFNFILGQLQVLNARCTLKGIRLYTVNLVTFQVEFHQVWQASKQAIRLDASQFIVVQKSAKIMEYI